MRCDRRLGTEIAILSLISEGFASLARHVSYTCDVIEQASELIHVDKTIPILIKHGDEHAYRAGIKIRHICVLRVC